MKFNKLSLLSLGLVTPIAILPLWSFSIKNEVTQQNITNNNSNIGIITFNETIPVNLTSKNYVHINNIVVKGESTKNIYFNPGENYSLPIQYRITSANGTWKCATSESTLNWNDGQLLQQRHHIGTAVYTSGSYQWAKSDDLYTTGALNYQNGLWNIQLNLISLWWGGDIVENIGGSGYPPYPSTQPPTLHQLDCSHVFTIHPSVTPFLDSTSFDKNKIIVPDYDKSFYDVTKSYLGLKLNEDYISADLMGWDTSKNQVSGHKDPITGNYDNSFWIQQPEISLFAKVLPQWALNDLSNAIINGKLIDCGVPSGIFDWAIPTTTIKPLEWYDNSEQSWSLSNFLIKHGHDDQAVMEQAINELSVLKWKNDYIAQHIEITSALQFDNYLDVVSKLLSQNLNYTLSYIDGADQSTPQTKIFNLKDLMGGEIALSFNYPSPAATWFQLRSCITNSGAFGTLGTSDTLGIYDIANNKVWSLNGNASNYWTFNPPAFVLSHAIDEIDGNPLDKNAGLFYGPTGFGVNPTAWDAFTKIIYTKTPSQIKAYIDAGKVPSSDTQGLGDVSFDKTCFVKVKEAFETSYTIDQLIDHIDYVPNDNVGILQLTIHFKDEVAGDQPQVLNVQLFAKNVVLRKHNRSRPVKIEPSQITKQYILDNLIAYNGATIGDDDSYLFETNLSKTEFTQALKGVVFKIQDDASGKIDVVFNICSNIYNMNPSGMPVPNLQSIEIIDNDFTPLQPLQPHNGTNLTVLWVVLAILGAGIATIVIVKLARRGKKYNSDYDTETIEDEINKRQQKSKIETNKTLDIKSDDDTEALKG